MFYENGIFWEWQKRLGYVDRITIKIFKTFRSMDSEKESKAEVKFLDDELIKTEYLMEFHHLINTTNLCERFIR